MIKYRYSNIIEYSSVVTGSGDETIRFWDAFGDKKKNSKKIGGIDGGVLDSLTSVR